MNLSFPLALLVEARTLAEAPAQAAVHPCPDCKTPLRIDEACEVCAMLRDYARERDGFGPARLSVRARFGPPPEIVADLKAQIDTFTAGRGRISHAPSRVRAQTNDARACAKKLARQRANAKRAKEARKKQRGR